MKRLIVAVLMSLFLIGTAVGEETTVATLIARLSIGPGEYTSPSLELVNCKSLKVQLNPHPSDWTDATILMTYSVEQTFDGGATWNHWIGGTLPGNSYRKDGSMPAIELYDPPDCTIRAKIVLNKKFRIGVDGTVTTY